MQVPQVDLRRQHGPLAAEILDVVSRALATGGFVGGAEVEGFESEFASYLGCRDVIGVSAGTAALHLVLRALELGAQDEVLVPANSFVATAEGVALAGARVRFCDVEPDTGLASRRTFEAALTERTKALVPVHLFGHVVDMDPIMDLAETRGLYVVEDAAQAHGARYLGNGEARRAGAIGHAGCFSFYPTKNLGSIGEGGAVSVQSDWIGRRVRELRDHGQTGKHVHSRIGDNARLHAIQAGALRIKLPYLDGRNAKRREAAARYDVAIAGLPLTPMVDPEWSESVYHQYVVRTSDRDTWRDALGGHGVGTGIHYPTPIHLQPAFESVGQGVGTCPVAERLAEEIVSLPMFAELEDAELDHISAALAHVAETLAGSTVSGSQET